MKLAIAMVVCLLAEPASGFAQTLAASSPAIVVTPPTIRPGQALHVSAVGFTTSNQVGTTFCVGLFGPGRNVELGLSPAFRPNLGTIAIDASGAGQSDVLTPAGLVAGSYQIVVGGCSPHLDIAPLASIASATIQVNPSVATPSPTPRQAIVPTSLPATGGIPGAGLVLLAMVGGFVAMAGWRLGRR